MADRVAAIVARDPRDQPPDRKAKPAGKKLVRKIIRPEDMPKQQGWAEMGLAQKPGERTVDADLPEHVRRVEGALGDENDQDVRGETGIDGLRTEDDRPLGWVEPSRIDRNLQPPMVHRGGTVATVSGPLRNALDAALSSPSGRGVVVDDAGRLIGSVTTAEVVELIEEHSAKSRSAQSPAGAGP